MTEQNFWKREQASGSDLHAESGSSSCGTWLWGNHMTCQSLCSSFIKYYLPGIDRGQWKMDLHSPIHDVFTEYSWNGVICLWRQSESREEDWRTRVSRWHLQVRFPISKVESSEFSVGHKRHLSVRVSLLECQTSHLLDVWPCTVRAYSAVTYIVLPILPNSSKR